MPAPLAVIFDLDDTLFDTAGAMLTALESLALAVPAFQGRTGAELFALQAGFMRQLDPEVFNGRLSGVQARRLRFERMLTACGDPDPDGEAVAGAYREVYRASFRQTPGAGELLTALRSHGLKIGVLTNYLREVQLETLEAVGLLPLIDALVTVSEAPPKPHRGGYLAVCAALGVQPAQAVMVGDHWANDVAGAVSAGLRAVWYNPSGRAASGDVPHTALAGFLPLEAALAALI